LVLEDDPVVRNSAPVLNLNYDRPVSALSTIRVVRIRYELDQSPGDVALKELVYVLACCPAGVLDNTFARKI
jgi:hypothetical protein